MTALEACLDELLGLIVGFCGGEQWNRLYQSLSNEKRALWRRCRPMHHGDLGFALLRFGIEKGNSFLIGMGKGLMLSDIRDIHEWSCLGARSHASYTHVA